MRSPACPVATLSTLGLPVSLGWHHQLPSREEMIDAVSFHRRFGYKLMATNVEQMMFMTLNQESLANRFKFTSIKREHKDPIAATKKEVTQEQTAAAAGNTIKILN